MTAVKIPDELLNILQVLNRHKQLKEVNTRKEASHRGIKYIFNLINNDRTHMKALY
jgi:hypothetical protein